MNQAESKILVAGSAEYQVAERQKEHYKNPATGIVELHYASQSGGDSFSPVAGFSALNVPPLLRGTLWEDNVFFEYADEKQEAEMRPAIVELAERLELKVIEY